MNQKIKNYLGIVGVAGILVAAYAVWSFAGTYASSVQPGTYRSFSVSSEGKTVAIPDIATFTASVITEGGKDLGSLQAQNTSKTNKIIAYLKDKGVEDKDIKTQSYNVDPRYQYSNCGPVSYGSSSTCPPPTIVGYTITQTVSVKIRDLAKAGAIIGGVVDSGANSVSQLQFTLDNPDAAKASARGEALAKAKAKAEEIAKQGGFGIGKLLYIQINDGAQYSPVFYGMGAGASSKAEAAPAPSVEPGSEEVKVSVTLTYEIN